MLSADDVSCSSSQISAKSEKNMADFDGEESGCEEELVQINSHAELSFHTGTTQVDAVDGMTVTRINSHTELRTLTKRRSGEKPEEFEKRLIDDASAPSF